jgi:D-cysteine desulfhydrase family pyridoxal phosphate-dependent enzyme
LFVKRDDLTGAGFGGNKVRKLEYLIAEALRNGADTVLTCGGLRSNHARITAAAAARAGLACHLILNKTAGPAHPASLFLNELYGAEVHVVESRTDRNSRMQAVAEELQRAGRKPFVIPLGGSIPLGALGFVDAAQELAEQAEPFDVIYVCSSSGGTQAGLDAGLQIAGWRETRLIGVSPDDSETAIATEVGKIRNGIAELLDRDPLSLSRPLHVNDGFIGEGYGIPSADSEAALRLLAKLEGLVLDPVYTSKAMAALLSDVQRGSYRSDQRVLFWHTGGQVALFTA